MSECGTAVPYPVAGILRHLINVLQDFTQLALFVTLPSFNLYYPSVSPCLSNRSDMLHTDILHTDMLHTDILHTDILHTDILVY
jgi:hypothetical protein